ncbi:MULTISPECIES: hypothetical protein [Halomonadaceae]|uniref:hypothetical protein n=1 Tax=Halomonadaceae TaxID=28256 RepID=UPI00159B460D|nr:MULTISPECIES: hypothetical protein [Halomonas]QJQ96220.1 hypothetical protein HIO72_13720 [Halomonas sp. PA5]
MRDLYKRLGVDRRASEGDITTAIEACQHATLRADARAVLEVKSRREEYDALHATLCSIGLLRARLGLTHGPHWLDSAANDFSLPPDETRSPYDDMVHRVSHAVALHDRWQRWHIPWLMPGLVVLGILLGAGACHWLW